MPGTGGNGFDPVPVGMDHFGLARAVWGHEAQRWCPPPGCSRRDLRMRIGRHWIMQQPGHGFLGCCSAFPIFTWRLM